MALRQIHFSPYYNSDEQDVIEQFYVPALSNCTEYRRVSAYFDSHILSLYSAGIENIVAAGGHIFFIFSDSVSEADFDMMVNGYQNRAKIEQDLLAKVETANPSVDLANLAYLIANGYADVKIAFTKEGIFHDKFGLINDGEDCVYFRGSNNETTASVQRNYEAFETSCSWLGDPNENFKIDNARSVFEKLWRDRLKDTRVIDIPDVVKEKIVTYSQGKLILSYLDKPNCLIFDCDTNGKAFVVNNLTVPALAMPGTHFYSRVFEPFVDSIEGKSLKLRDDLSYFKINKIIGEVQKAADFLHFDCYVSGRLRRFLRDSDLKLDSRRSLGTAIKEKDPLIQADYEAFVDALASQLARPLIGDQSWASYHIIRMKRAANFSVPGAGKTAMVLAAFSYLYHQGLVDKIMMVGPLNAFESWKKEWRATLGDHIPLKAFDYQEQPLSTASKRHDAIVYGAKDTNLILMNYESLKGNIDELNSVIDSKTFLVFDEVHRIKSITGERARAALSLCKKAVYRVVMTGTPVPNGYLDIYNFLHILFPDEYDDFFGFDYQYLALAKSDPFRQKTVNEAINPFFFALNKDDLKVPPPEPDDVTSCTCQENEDDKELMAMLYRHYRNNILLLYVRLIQASSNPGLLLKDIDESALGEEEDDDYYQKMIGNDRDGLTEKEAAFVENLPMGQKFYKGIDLVSQLTSQHEQVMVWALFVDTIEKIASTLKNRGINCRVIYGAVPLEERTKIVDDYVNKRFDVLIANPNTLAESVSLHKNCHHAVYFEYSFNLVHMLQSRDRIHRVGLLPGQKTYYHYCMLEPDGDLYAPLDKKIYERLAEKAQLQKEAISANNLSYTSDNPKQDILDLMAEVR